MGLSSLIRLIGTSKPRFVTVDGRLISGDAVHISNGRAVHPNHGRVTHVPRHADHGGPDPGEDDDPGQTAWWLCSPERLAAEAVIMESHFPGFRPIIRGGKPGWAGTVDTGYGRFPVEMVHRAGMSVLPEVRVIGRRLERKEGGRFRPSDHLFASGALCYASAEDYRPADGHNAVTVVAWVAHWLAEYVHWRLSGVWPSKGPVVPHPSASSAEGGGHLGFTAIATTGEWIRSADNKAAILGGFAVAVAAGLFTNADQIALTLRTGGTHGWLARSTFGGATTLLLVAVSLLLCVLWPRTPEPDSPNRHAFPSVARRRIAGGTVNPQASDLEAAVETPISATIAMRKFRLVKLATVALAASFLLLTAWRIAVSTLGT